jgi:uncharacterized DUF497 family protein
MEIDFDPAKNALNIQQRGLSFERVAHFDFQTAVFSIDDRFDYGETRHRALGFIDGRLYALVFVETAAGIRVISFRKANKREVNGYEAATKP